MELIDKSSAAQFIASMVPEWDWLLGQIESDGGYVRFPSQFSNIIRNLKIEDYPKLYESEKSIGGMMLLAFLDPTEAKELNEALVSAAPEKRGALLDEALNTIKNILETIEFPKTPIEQQRAQATFDALTEEERREHIQFLQRFMMAFLGSFHQSLSMMVHGEKLTSLISQAKSGNDKAFAKAIQIDKRILTVVPYFKQRFDAAHTEGDSHFLEEIGAHLNRPPYRGRIRHKSLYLTFSLLEMVGLLDGMPHRELLDFCDEAGVGGFENRIEDVKNLSKRLAEYKRFQRLGMDVSTP